MKISQLTYVTGNNFKFEVAKKAFAGSGIEITQTKMDLPEIQSESVEEIAGHSAKIAAQKLGMPVLVGDVGYSVEALSGFPGPFIKYMNKWLTVQDWLNLMQGKENRSMIIKEALAYCEPNSEPTVFTGSFNGLVALKAGPPGKNPVNQVWIPEGYNKVETEIPEGELVQGWIKTSGHWEKLIKYLKTK